MDLRYVSLYVPSVRGPCPGSVSHESCYLGMGTSCGILPYWNLLDQNTLAGTAQVRQACLTVVFYLSIYI